MYYYIIFNLLLFIPYIGYLFYLNNKNNIQIKNKINEINDIYEKLELSIINNDIIQEIYINNVTYIIFNIVIYKILLILLIYISLLESSLVIIYYIKMINIILNCFPLIGLLLYLIFNNIMIKYINKIISEKQEELYNKKDRLHKIYLSELIVNIDNNINNIDITDIYTINYLNYLIDEYILNVNNLYKICNLNSPIKNKKDFINNELKQLLINNKKKELTNIMKRNLRELNEIINVIVKYELDEYNKNLNDYINNIEFKISKINELIEINEIIINIDN